MPDLRTTLLTQMAPYIGAPYRWTLEGLPADGPGAPFWMQVAAPTPDEVKANGCLCVGLVNIVLAVLGSPTRFKGTGDIWERFHTIATPCQPGADIPDLALLFSGYRDEKRQGHVAIALNEGNGCIRLFHCYVDDPEPQPGLLTPGIRIDDSLEESHSWYEGGTYEGWIPFSVWTQ